jgi:hypothetical protein
MDTGKREWGISGFTLKMVAVITMLVDHVAATVLERMLILAGKDVTVYPLVSAHWQEYYNFYTVLRGIGRLAFPIYCFLIVEGFLHTRSVAKYAARLFVFALLSEVPFDLAFQKSFWDMSYNNVFFTLFLGLLVIAGIRYVNQQIACAAEDGGISFRSAVLRSLLNLVIIFAGMALAEVVLRCDYGAAGILTIVVLYEFRSHPKTAMALAAVLLTVLASELEIVALLDVLLIAFYNGRRGRQAKLVFYAFYPVHLLVLSAICAALGLGL